MLLLKSDAIHINMSALVSSAVLSMVHLSIDRIQVSQTKETHLAKRQGPWASCSVKQSSDYVVC